MRVDRQSEETAEAVVPFKAPPAPDDVTHLRMLRPAEVIEELSAEQASHAANLRALAVYHGAAGTNFDRMQRRLKAIEQAATTYQIVQENRDEIQKIVERRKKGGRA